MLTPEQFLNAEQCLHDLLQCTYAAPLYQHHQRANHLNMCQYQATQCYQKLIDTNQVTPETRHSDTISEHAVSDRG